MKLLLFVFVLILMGCSSDSNPVDTTPLPPPSPALTIMYRWSCSNYSPSGLGWNDISASITYTIKDGTTMTVTDKRSESSDVKAPTVQGERGKTYKLRGYFSHDSKPDGQMTAQLYIYLDSLEVAVWRSDITSQPISHEISYTIPNK